MNFKFLIIDKFIFVGNTNFIYQGKCLLSMDLFVNKFVGKRKKKILAQIWIHYGFLPPLISSTSGQFPPLMKATMRELLHS